MLVISVVNFLQTQDLCVLGATARHCVVSIYQPMTHNSRNPNTNKNKLHPSAVIPLTAEVSGSGVFTNPAVKSWTSVCKASDWHLTNVTVTLLFALQCTSEKPSQGILSLSGITLWTTCSSGAMSSGVVVNNAAGLVTLLLERCVVVKSVWIFFSVFYFFCVCMSPLIFYRQDLELSPSLLLCISLELINSLGLYDWGDCLGALNLFQLIKN